jgi:PAS domain S-box-containing protein
MGRMGHSSTELLLDRAHNGVISMDEQGLVTYWNPSAERMFGIVREQAVGQAVRDLIIPERLRDQHSEGLKRFLRDGTTRMLDRRIELPAIKADGTEFPVELTISAIRDGDNWAFHAFLLDINERREAEHEHQRLVDQLRGALHRSEMRFDAIVGSLEDAVTIRDREHRIVYANKSALEHLGFESAEELRGATPGNIIDDYIVTAEDGSEVKMEDIPSVRILAGEPADPLLIRTVHKETGIVRWQLLKAAPLRDDSGSVEATIMIIENVTERKQAELRASFLARAGAVLASSLDYEQTLRNVAELLVPDIADWCAVDLVDADGDRRQLAVAHVDPARLKLAEQLRDYEPERPDPEQGLGLVLRTGETAYYPEITDEMLVQGAADERHLELMRTIGTRAAAVVPIRLGGRTLGAMTLVSAESARALGQFELDLAEQLAARAAVAIENARLYSERSAIAYTLQQSLLPEELPEIPGYELGAAYIPALESSQVGGDFYDVWRVGSAWVMIIGDVTGKGVEAATLTALVRHTIRAVAEFESSPAALLQHIDSILKKQRATSICTALCFCLEDDRLLCAVGGHPLPIYVDQGRVETIGVRGPLLGGFDDVTWEDQLVEIAPGGTLVAYTDGVTDAIGKDGTRYGTDRLYDTLASAAERSAADVVRQLVSELERFQEGRHADDTAALVLRRVPVSDMDRVRRAEEDHRAVGIAADRWGS